MILNIEIKVEIHKLAFLIFITNSKVVINKIQQ
ncbi:hypothetical protein RCH18_000580 [Flavobacterium sp. PL11]|jgi:hypothetical protein|nr:hypothetical protein [Flavobacterium sp. PL11]